MILDEEKGISSSTGAGVGDGVGVPEEEEEGKGEGEETGKGKGKEIEIEKENKKGALQSPQSQKNQNQNSQLPSSSRSRGPFSEYSPLLSSEYDFNTSLRFLNGRERCIELQCQRASRLAAAFRGKGNSLCPHLFHQGWDDRGGFRKGDGM